MPHTLSKAAPTARPSSMPTRHNIGLLTPTRKFANMALTKRSNLGKNSSAHDDDAGSAPQRRMGGMANREAPAAYDDGAVVSLAAT